MEFRSVREIGYAIDWMSFSAQQTTEPEWLEDNGNIPDHEMGIGRFYQVAAIYWVMGLSWEDAHTAARVAVECATDPDAEVAR